MKELKTESYSELKVAIINAMQAIREQSISLSKEDLIFLCGKSVGLATVLDIIESFEEYNKFGGYL